jgi:hypothetical protein
MKKTKQEQKPKEPCTHGWITTVCDYDCECCGTSYSAQCGDCEESAQDIIDDLQTRIKELEAENASLRKKTQ